MRGFYGFILSVFFVLYGKPVFGQVSGDTLGLTGTMADTVVADRLFEEMKELKGIILFTPLKITSAYLVILTGKY